MANADDLRTLTEDMAAAYEARMALLASIREQANNIKAETAEMMAGFKDADNVRASDVASLKTEVSDLIDGFRNELNEIKRECEDTAAAWHDLVAEMRTKRGGRPAQKYRAEMPAEKHKSGKKHKTGKSA